MRLADCDGAQRDWQHSFHAWPSAALRICECINAVKAARRFGVQGVLRRPGGCDSAARRGAALHASEVWT